MQELVDRVDSLITRSGREHMYKLVLEGNRDADMEIENYLLERCGRVVSIKDNTGIDININEIYAQNRGNIIGMYIDKVRGMDISDELKDKTLNYGLGALYKYYQEDGR